MADEAGRFKMIAVDQRPPITNPIKAKRGTDVAPWADVAAVKAMLVEELQADSSAMLLDPHYAYPKAISLYSPAKGLIVTLEDSRYEATPGGRFSKQIDDWCVQKIKRIGGDAVKVLAWYRPDADRAVNQRQQDFAERIGAECVRYDIPYVFELLVYPLAKELEQTSEYVELKTKRPELVLESVQTFANSKFAVDLFKLESPLAVDDVPGIGSDGAAQAQKWFEELDEAAGRPWVMLSAGASMSAFRRVLAHAYAAGASGYLAGRAIWLNAFEHFPAWRTMRSSLRKHSVPYMRELNALTDAGALPWFVHRRFEQTGLDVRPAGADFCRSYQGFGG